jgi:uncharacterized OB-fold protein
MSGPDVPFRILPRVTDRNRHFWEGGREGKLQFLRCTEDGTYVHPPTPFCPTCRGKSLAVEAVSGRATVATFSVNHQAWMPGPELPYVLAIVEIEEDPRVRLTTNIVGCEPDDVTIGMPVQVIFEAHDGDVWLPLFEPAGG